MNAPVSGDGLLRDFVARYFPHAKVHGDRWQARCPAHEDGTASLSLARGHDGKVLLKCFAGCDTAAIVAALGCELRDLFAAKDAPPPTPPPRRIVAEYVYRLADGTPSFRVQRTATKQFWQHKADGRGGWLTKKFDAVDVVYRLDRLHGQTKYVLVAEGEKDVGALEALGLYATCNAGGASTNGAAPKWKPHHTQQLVTAGVCQAVVLPDNDAPGQAHMHAVASSLQAAGIDVRWLALPDLPPKGVRTCRGSPR